MKYSFTQPLPKSIISHTTKIWIFYILLSIGIIYGYGIYLNYQISTINSHANLSSTDITQSDEAINELNEKLRKMRYEAQIDTDNKTHNADVAGALGRIFDLVPNQITINYVELQENTLTIKGITPTREAYAFLLEAPLRSAFHKSRADFYALPNGWFNFTSISTNNPANSATQSTNPAHSATQSINPAHSATQSR